MNPAHTDMDEVAEFGVALNQREGFHRITACSGPCRQGRENCPCPESCEVSADDPHEGWGAWVVPALMAASLAAVGLLWALSGYLPGVK